MTTPLRPPSVFSGSRYHLLQEMRMARRPERPERGLPLQSHQVECQLQPELGGQPPGLLPLGLRPWGSPTQPLLEHTQFPILLSMKTLRHLLPPGSRTTAQRAGLRELAGCRLTLLCWRLGWGGVGRGGGRRAGECLALTLRGCRWEVASQDQPVPQQGQLSWKESSA